MTGLLLILVGPAGAGKTTLAHRLIAARPEARGFSVSHTSRPMRASERLGLDYFFVDRPQFEALRDSGQLAESAEVHGNYYGTSHAEIKRLTRDGGDAIFDIDIAGAHNLWRAYPDHCRLVFVVPPSWGVLVQRLRDRGSETEQTLRRRLRTAWQELETVQHSPAPWWLVVNERLSDAVQRLEQIAAPIPPPHDAAGHPTLRAFVRDAAGDPLAES